MSTKAPSAQAPSANAQSAKAESPDLLDKRSDQGSANDIEEEKE
jgi:hypothetical protein